MPKKLTVVCDSTIGVLIKAKKNGLICKLKPLLDKLRDFGFWIGDSLYSSILIQVDERIEEGEG